MVMIHCVNEWKFDINPPTGSRRPHGLTPFNKPLIKEMVLEARDIAGASTLGDRRQWREPFKQLPLPVRHPRWDGRGHVDG